MALPINKFPTTSIFRRHCQTCFRGLVFLLALLVLPPLCLALDENERPADSVILSELITAALGKNQQMISAEQAAKRYTSRIPLIDIITEPLMTYYYLGYPISNMGGGQVEKRKQGTIGKGITNTFKRRTVRGKILTGRDMVENLALWYEYSADDLRLQLTMQVREAFYRSYFLDRVIGVTRNSLTLLDSLIEACDTQYSVGKIRQRDLLNIQQQRYQLTARLLELQQQRQQWATSLNYLAARPIGSKVDPWIDGGIEYETLIEPKDPASTLTSGLIHNRPLIKGYQALGGRFRAMRSMAKMYSNREVRTEAWAEADFGFRSIKAEGIDFYNKTAAEIKTAMDNLTSYREQARLYGRVLVPQTRQLYQTNLADFTVGLGDYRDTLASLLDLDQYQVKYFETLANYQVDLVRLESLSGMTLIEPRR